MSAIMAGYFGNFQRPPQIDSAGDDDEPSMSVDRDAPAAPETQTNGAASQGRQRNGAATSAPSGQVGTAYVSTQELFSDYRRSFLNVAPYNSPDAMDIDDDDEGSDEEHVGESEEGEAGLSFGQQVYLTNWRDVLFAQLAVLRDQSGLSANARGAIERIESVSLQINAVLEGEDHFPRGNTAIVEDLERSDASSSASSSEPSSDAEPAEGVRGTPPSSFDEEELFGPPDSELSARTEGVFDLVRPTAREQMLDAGDPDGPPQPSSESLQRRRREARERAQSHLAALRPVGQRPGQQYPESAVQYSEQRGLHLGDRGDCFLCSWRDEHHDGMELSHIRKLFEIFWNEVARADSVSLALTLSFYYFNNIYDASKPYPPLTPEVALAHIEGVHVLEPTISMVVWIRRLEMMCSRAMSTCFTRNIDDSPGPMDKDQVSCFKILNDLLLKWRSLNPDKMAFANTSTQKSHKEMAPPFNINALITTRSEKARGTPARMFV